MKKKSILLGVGTLIVAGGIAFSTSVETYAESQDAPTAEVEKNIRAENGEERGRFNSRMPMHNLSKEEFQNMRKHHSKVHNGRMNGENGFGPHCHF